ncbi:MAG: tagaturonate reductase [Clostridia bacterium]|nr:tagaturonate reductase [Clostridia bacterium]
MEKTNGKSTDSLPAINDVFGTKKKRPIKVVQFGQGNFLRAFALDFVDRMNEKGIFDGSVAVVKTTARGDLEDFRRQNGLYTVIYRGASGEEKRIISCIEKAVSTFEDPAEFFALAKEKDLRLIISNTTEAGIALGGNDHFYSMPESFPGKLTKLLYLRFAAFGGDPEKGVYVIPCELIENNAAKLRACVKTLTENWKLGEDFSRWIDTACFFSETLVDRIVSGKPKEALTDYSDALADVCEPFGLWVIEKKGNIENEFPLRKAGINAVFTDNVKPYRERKVRILNGSHTGFALLGHLAGFETVKDCMDDASMRAFITKLQNEALAPYVPLPENEVRNFVKEVNARFENPYLHHALLSICLNSTSKYKARLLPSLKDAAKAGKEISEAAALSLAALMRFYRGKIQDGVFYGEANGKKYAVTDNEDVLRFFCGINALGAEEYAERIMANTFLWGEDLREIPGLEKKCKKYLLLLKKGVDAALSEVMK